MSSGYKDIRIDFFKEHFNHALKYDQYIETGEISHAQKWKNYENKISLTDEQSKIISTFKRKMPILVMSGIWCGDCARQGPMFKVIEKESNNLMDFRFIDNRQYPKLQDELRINGAEKVPVVVAFSEDFYELSRFGDRHLSVYKNKVNNELGAACDPGILTADTNKLQTELGEWVSFFERLQLLLRLAPMLRRRYND